MPQGIPYELKMSDDTKQALFITASILAMGLLGGALIKR